MEDQLQNPQLTPDEAAASLAFATNLSEKHIMPTITQNEMAQNEMGGDMPTDDGIAQQDAPITPEMPPASDEEPEYEDTITPEIEGLKNEIKDLNKKLEERDKKHQEELKDIKKTLKDALDD